MLPSRLSLHTPALVDGSHTLKGGEGGEAEGWGGAMEDNVAFQFSLGPAKTAVVLTITEEVNARVHQQRWRWFGGGTPGVIVVSK